MTEMVQVWINDRWPLLLPSHRADRPEWPWWEAGRLASMWHFLGQGGEVVYDIGAEEGDFPALWSSWGNDVVLFEPNDRVWPNVKFVWEANQLRPPLACWRGFAGPSISATGDMLCGMSIAGKLGEWPSCAFGEVIGDHGFKTMPEYPEIPVITIDEMATLSKPPTAITIDVEGAEHEVLMGAQGVMAEHRPKIWVSVHQEFARETYGDEDVLEAIKDLMMGHGYDQGTFIAHDHESHWLWLPVEYPSAVAWP